VQQIENAVGKNHALAVVAQLAAYRQHFLQINNPAHRLSSSYEKIQLKIFYY
jgi:hypothetical protein